MGTFKQRSTAGSGTVTAQNTKQSVALIHNAGSLIATLTIAFPANPVDGQEFIISSQFGVTALTLSSGSTILGLLTAIVAAGFGRWIYDITDNAWYRIG